MLISNARSSIRTMSRFGAMCAIAVGMLVGYSSTATLGGAAGITLICIFACFETVALCVLTAAEKEEN